MKTDSSPAVLVDMRTFPDIRIRAVLAQGERANLKLNEGDNPGALSELRALSSRLSRLGLTSGWVRWATAVALDLSNEPLAALEEVEGALAADPLNSAFNSSHEVILNRLRTRLASSPDGDPQVPLIYNRLQKEEACDVPSHLAWARYLVHSKSLDEAAQVLEAITLLAPAFIDAWQLRAHVERARGNELAAAESEAEASMRRGTPVAFGIPGTEAKS